MSDTPLHRLTLGQAVQEVSSLRAGLAREKKRADAAEARAAELERKVGEMLTEVRAARALCPDTDPGPAYDEWGDARSWGNQEDVAADVADEQLWKVAVILDRAAALSEPEGGV